MAVMIHTYINTSRPKWWGLRCGRLLTSGTDIRQLELTGSQWTFVAVRGCAGEVKCVAAGLRYDEVCACCYSAVGRCNGEACKKIL